jgi:short-subunit dehydrogenase
MADDRGSKTALVTGASTGIGYELAKLLAQDGYNLILVSRDQAKLVKVAAELEASHQCRAAVLAKDLTVAGTPDEIFEMLQQNSIQLDVLVNNAGFGGLGPFHRMDMQKVLDMIQLNVTALVHLTRLVVPDMVARGKGYILNIASTAAFQPGPYMAVYYATKAFVVSFSEAVESELKGTGVSVTTLCPGPTKTEFHARAGMQHSRLGKSFFIMEAGPVARIGYDAMLARKRTVIAGVKNRMLAFVASRLVPKKLLLGTVASLNKNR